MRAPHEIHDLRQGGVPSDPRGTEHECAVTVHRPADHFGSGPLLCGDRLTGQHCLIHRGGALHDTPVHRDALARSHAHEIADADFFERHVDLRPGPDDTSGTSLQSDQCLDGAHGLALRPRLQPATGQDQADDRGRAVEVGLRFDAGGAKQIRRECHEHAECPRRGRAHDNERVHARRSVACGPQGGAVETAPGQELDGRCGTDEDPRGLFHRPGRVGQVHHQHRDCRDGQRNGRGQAERPLLACSNDRFGVRLVEEGRAAATDSFGNVADLVPGRLDGLRYLVEPGCFRQVADGSNFGREVDVGLGDAGGLAQVALDPIDARSAAHALDGQLDLGGRGGGRCCCFDCLHTPREYMPAVEIRQRGAFRRSGHYVRLAA